MTYAEEFIADFSRCFSDSAWLPFVSLPRYRIEAPNPRSRECSACGIFHFSLLFSDQKVGHLELVPKWSERILTINRICSCYENFKQVVGPRQIGKELVRRSVKFALTKGFEKLTTSVMTAPTFFIGLGFRPDRYNSSAELIQLLTRNVGRGRKKINGRWLEEIERDPDAIWAMARTKAERAFLDRITGCGRIDFSDEKQLRYVSSRLEL